jgi:hypothetical protein
MHTVFREAHAAAAATGDTRVAVLVCGNNAILERCRGKAAEFSRAGVTFECHFEAFGF